jgi:purine nucleoside permease
VSNAARVSAANLVRAAMPLVEAIAQNWDAWRRGVPAASAP